MKLTRVSTPGELITLAEAKSHLNYDDDDKDDEITSMMLAAVEMLDGPNGAIGKALVQQNWQIDMAGLKGAARLELPLTPFISLVSIKYYDADDVLQTASNTDYTIFGGEDFGYIEPKTSWPEMADKPDAMQIIFQAGFGAVTAVPETIKRAARLLIGHMFENREAVSEMSFEELPWALQSQIDMHRVGWIK